MYGYYIYCKLTFYGTLNPAAGTGTVTQTLNNNNFCMPVVGGYGGSTWEMNFGMLQSTPVGEVHYP
jgi:hypothetical protein